MHEKDGIFDAIIIGGGFYGLMIAIYLKKYRGLNRVIILEKEKEIFTKASFNNQARVHGGYHYPRSFITAFRSRANLPRFLQDWPQCIYSKFTHLYGIARHNSKITSSQFKRFCSAINAPIIPAKAEHINLFEKKLVEDVFIAEEHAFDAKKLTQAIELELRNANVNVLTNTKAVAINKLNALTLELITEDNNYQATSFKTRFIFNCTYSNLNHLNGDFPGIKKKLKQEIAEISIDKVPSCLKNIGITIMDGYFFSLMPFPSMNLHSLSHVRYTPHCNWTDMKNIIPDARLNTYNKETRYDRMIRDAGRYVPVLLNSSYIESIFEVKTVLNKNEIDDGRPILFERHTELPGCFSILGGKLDNIYDILEKLDEEYIN